MQGLPLEDVRKITRKATAKGSKKNERVYLYFITILYKEVNLIQALSNDR